MNTARGQIGLEPGAARQLAAVHLRLAEAEAALRAIRSGEVDTLVVMGKQGPRVFTLQGAEHTYRLLIESMNEGALTLASDQMILYANRCFARMVKSPLEQVVGRSFRRFLSVEGQVALRPVMKRADRSGAKVQVHLLASDGTQIPAQISLSATSEKGVNPATIGMVVTDLTETRRTEDLLRALTHRVVQVQEDERGRVALELHDGITQLLCAILFRSQALVVSLSARDGLARSEAKKLRDMAGETAKEVERISRNLRPSILNHLGLVAALRDASTEFADRTGLSVKLVCVELAVRLPADTELTLYRILQEALRNVEKHAHARHLTVDLTQHGAFIRLAIHDDGIGFDQNRHPAKRNPKGGLGLLGMRERANFAGGVLNITSARRTGTEVAVSLPLTLKVKAARAKSPRLRQESASSTNQRPAR